MTPEERQRLRDFIAQKVMGWEFFNTECLKLYSDPTTGRGVIYYKDFAPDDPASPTSQILGVIEKMRELGWWLSLYESPPNEYGWLTEFERRDKRCIKSGVADNPLDAILLAARKAVEGR